MEKFNKIKEKDELIYLMRIFSILNYLEKKNPNLIEDITSMRNTIKDFAGAEYMKAIEYSKNFSKIEDYCEKFFDCSESGFSYELGCRYQKIDFDFTDNINGEIRWLKNLLRIYNTAFKEEIKLIKNLISDLEIFKNQFDEYLNS